MLLIDFHVEPLRRKPRKKHYLQFSAFSASPREPKPTFTRVELVWRNSAARHQYRLFHYDTKERVLENSRGLFAF
jgi:hypothetical protein